LPQGQYPIFNRVPKRQHNYKINEIERIREEEEIIRKKRLEKL